MSWKYNLVFVRRVCDRHIVGARGASVVRDDCRHTGRSTVLQVRVAVVLSVRKRVEYGGGAVSLLLNILWIIFSGIPLAIEHAAFGLLFAVTIIGIPFAKQHFKLSKLALMPFGTSGL